MSHGGKREGAGKKKGSKHKKTLEREAAAKAYDQLVLAQLKPLFRKQLWLAMGQTYVFRKEKHGTGASMRIEHVLLEHPHEVADALDVIANGDENFPSENGYVYITTKSPENNAINSMLDRGLGKVTQKLEHGGKDGGPIQIAGVDITIRRNEGKL